MKTLEINRGVSIILDDEDYEFAKRLGPSTNEQGFVGVKFEHKNKVITIGLHYLLFGTIVRGDKVPVHNNKDRYDFRKENISFIPQSHFLHAHSNTYTKKKRTSKYRGVHVGKREKGTWKWSIMHAGKRHQGRCKTENEAAAEYNKKARELFGENAYQNVIE